MKRLSLLASLGVAATLGAMLAMPGAAGAWGRHYHYRYMHRYPVRHYHRIGTRSYLNRVYGTYPNIRYFQRDGHVYYHNYDTGRNYLAHW